MKTITEDNLVDLIKKEFPNFIPYWEEDVECFGADQGIITQMMPFRAYTIDRIKANDEAELRKIFDLVEFGLCNGDEAVQTAMATGFLEGVLHRDPDTIKFSTVVKYLGEQSIGYCRAWDEFTGVQTERLWDAKQTDS